MLYPPCLAVLAASMDNGLANTPPMTWRSWYSFFGAIDQPTMEVAMRAMAEKARATPGRAGLVSYADLGYDRVGLDDGWQACGAGVNGSFHDAGGNPIIDLGKFPDMGAMVGRARALGLKSGWYMNNCMCGEGALPLSPSFLDAALVGNVAAIARYGFSAVKLDGCGPHRNLTTWAALLNATRPTLVEDCHWGNTVPTGGAPTPAPRPPSPGPPPFGPGLEGGCTGVDKSCPFNLYRATGDGINSFERVVANLHGLLPFLGSDSTPPLSGPSTWAFPDGLQAGRFSGPWNASEDRYAFGMYCVTSSPLVLGHNITDGATNDRVWPVVANVEAIAVNQAWAGHPGRRVSAWGGGAAAAEAVRWPAGRAAYDVPCVPSDATQTGWSYNATSRALQKDGQCLDMRAADNRQLWLAPCKGGGGYKPQQWQWLGVNGSDGSASLNNLQNGGNATAPGAQNSFGFARKHQPHLAWRVTGAHGQLMTAGDGAKRPPSCIAARSINPPPQTGPYELWSKPLSGGRVAALLVNHGLPANVSFALAELGLAQGAKAVRDVWKHADLGPIAAGGSFTAELPVHDAAFLVLDPL